jgi:inhibitor of cysteine peptidase
MHYSGVPFLLFHLLLAIGLLSGWGLSGQAACHAEENTMSVITLTEADQGKTVTVRPGQSVVVQLAENPTTGFRWALAQGNEEIVTLRDSNYVMAPGAGIGGGGQRTFTFEARKPGSVQLQLKLWREWEGEPSVLQRFNVTIEVRG